LSQWSNDKQGNTKPNDKKNAHKVELPNIFGSTTTNKVTIQEVDIANTGIFGDKVTVSSYQGKVTGKDGIITTDVSTTGKKIDGASISIPAGFSSITLGLSSDMSISVGTGVGGYEGHVGFGMGIGLGQISGGGSYTDKNKKVSGGDLTIRPGLGTATAAIAAYAFPYLASALAFGF